MNNTAANSKKDTVTQSRQIEQLFAGVDTQDGAGVKLTRVLTQQLQQRLDPYLMLDNFKSDNTQSLLSFKISSVWKNLSSLFSYFSNRTTLKVGI